MKSFRDPGLRQKALAVAVVAASVICGVILPQKLSVTLTGSLKQRVFWISGKPESASVKRGDFVLFSKENPWPELSRGNTTTIKEVACLPGEHLSSRDGVFFCNAAVLGKALRSDSHGNRLTTFEFSGVIPSQAYFVVGHDPRSYDSKYFGFIHHDEITSKVIPLF